MLDAKQSQKLSKTILLAAQKAAGRVAAGTASEASVHLYASRRANTRFAAGEVTSCGDVEDTSARIWIALGRRHASVTTNQLDAASIEAAAERAVRLARLAPEDPEFVSVLGAQHYAAQPSGFDNATERLGAGPRADAIGEALGAAQQAQLQLAGFYRHGAHSTAFATSKGLFAYYPWTEASLTMTARTPDGLGSGWAGAISSRASDLKAGMLAERAITKARASRAPVRLEPGRMTVVLEPAAVAELLNMLGGSLHARAADEGRSVFSRPGGGTRIGEPLFGAQTSLWSDPAEPMLPVAPFDENGMSRGRTKWIEEGKLEALEYSRYWAAKQGKAPTAEPGGYVLSGGDAESIDALIRGVDRGVLVTRLWYTRMVDPREVLLTSLTRDGTFLIEKGEITRPVNNFRLNESPVKMLANADARTRETWRSPLEGSEFRVPALRTHDFNFASISEAV